VLKDRRRIVERSPEKKRGRLEGGEKKPGKGSLWSWGERPSLGECRTEKGCAYWEGGAISQIGR